MQSLHFEIVIHAAVAKVYDSLLGLSHKATYEYWTSPFNPKSTYIGSWEKGSKIKFVATNAQGEQEGMIAQIKEHIPQRFVSIQHLGIIRNNQEITQGSEAAQWAGCFENYTLQENDGLTLVQVDLQTPEAWVPYMSKTFPLALARLKQWCEQP